VQLFVAQDAVGAAVDVYVVRRVGGRGAQLLAVRYGKVHPASVRRRPASGSLVHGQAAPLLSAAIALNSINSASIVHFFAASEWDRTRILTKYQNGKLQFLNP